MKAALTVALSFALACGSSEESTAPAADTTSGAEAPESGASESAGLAGVLSPLVVAPITLTDARGAAVRVDANGQLSMDGQEGPAPIFHSSGDITMQGQTLATISSEGVLRTAAGQVVAVIGPDGAADIGGLNLSFAADGTLAGANAEGPGITLAPADSPAKRLAMSVIILMLSASPPEPGDNAGPATSRPGPTID